MITTINPYRTREPFVWAGSYLLFRGRVIGYIDYEPSDPYSTTWITYSFIYKDGSIHVEPERIASDHYQSGAMKDLEIWVGEIISHRQDWLDTFMQVPVDTALPTRSRV